MHSLLSTSLGLLGLSALVQAAPGSQIPSSKSTVSVKVINPTIAKGTPPSALMEPVINGTYSTGVPFYSFLIEHKGKNGKLDRLVWDLGVRKDIENSVPDVAATVKALGVQLDTPLNYPEILSQGGVDPASISSILWSHWHFDHIGDASLFPKAVNLTVGPGFKSAFLPGFPDNAASPLKQDAVEGRNVNELDFSTSKTKIASFSAIDWYGDGSFYVINTPGHAIGHISALARTTPDTYILMGGDVAHHAGELRPTKYVPLPAKIKPSPFKLLSAECVGEFAQNVHPKHSRTEPFMEPVNGGFNADKPKMVETLSIVQELDANPNVFTIIAHDITMLPVIDFFPAAANDWKKEGWKDATKWSFLSEFAVY